MRCDLDGAEQPQQPSEDWINDRTWGLVHQHAGQWHTVTRTLLLRVEGGFEPVSGMKPSLPGMTEGQ